MPQQTSISLCAPLILASASPRRRELLRAAGYHFTVAPPTRAEPAVASLAHVPPAARAEALAYFKARAVAAAHPEAIVVGADTLVVHEGETLGKPRDQAHARRILSTMFAGLSDVITALAVLGPSPNERIITHVTTSLIMRPMDQLELETYLASDAWRDKAGAYALQEGGDRFVRSIEGSRTNIVGLPMERLNEILRRFRV